VGDGAHEVTIGTQELVSTHSEVKCAHHCLSTDTKRLKDWESTLGVELILHPLLIARTLALVNVWYIVCGFDYYYAPALEVPQGSM
jgi:hypothetical protein